MWIEIFQRYCLWESGASDEYQKRVSTLFCRKLTAVKRLRIRLLLWDLKDDKFFVSLWVYKIILRFTKAPSTRIRIILNPQLFLLRILLPFTRFRRIRHTNPQLFESALQSGNVWICTESDIVWTLKSGYVLIRWRNKIESSLYRLNNQYGRRTKYNSFSSSWTYFKSCAGKSSCAKCALQLCQRAARHFIIDISPRKAVNLALLIFLRFLYRFFYLQYCNLMTTDQSINQLNYY